MTVICPCARNDRAFQDPTHRRFIVSQTFLYLIKEWRDVNKLDHYNVQCDFNAMCQPATVNAEVNLLSDAAKSRRFTENWNTIDDWIARLQKKPVPSSPAKS